MIEDRLRIGCELESRTCHSERQPGAELTTPLSIVPLPSDETTNGVGDFRNPTRGGGHGDPTSAREFAKQRKIHLPP